MVKYRTITNTETDKKEYIIDNFLDFDDLLYITYDIKSKDYKNENIIIKQKVEYKHQNIDKAVNFSHCIFEENVNFAGTTFIDTIIINSIFNKSANFNNCTFQGEATNFTNTKFNGDTQFQNANFSSEITNFQKTEFNNKTLFIKADFHNKVSIGATFTDNVNFNEAKFLGDRIKFNGSTFNKKVRFHHCKFHHWVEFENTTFKDLVDFYDATFEREQQFYRVDFENVSIFSNTKFKGETQFLYCTTDPDKTYLNFESAEFDKYVDISRCNFNNNLNFWNVKISENLDLSNTKYYKDSFGIHKNDTPNAHTLIRESYRRIKKSFADNGNKIAESEFAGREQNIYLKELLSEYEYDHIITFIIAILSLFIIIIKIGNFSILLTVLLLVYFSIKYKKLLSVKIIVKSHELIMLLLNKISNNFGRNWIYGVAFTLIVGIITFVLLIQTSDYDSKEKITDYIPDFIKVFNVLDIKPFDSDNDMFKNKQFEFYLTLIIGRIFIGYGYYQTIQAFRKYGKS